MKIILTHRYFIPDKSPYGAIIYQIAKEISDAGHDVEIFTSKHGVINSSSENFTAENNKKIKVHRTFVLPEYKNLFFIRLINILFYCLGLFFHIIRSRANIVSAGTFPPVLAAWIACTASKFIGAKFIYHIQDIHPEVTAYSKPWIGRNIYIKIFRYLDNQTLGRADKIITLSKDMLLTLKERGISNLPIEIVNNPPLVSYYKNEKSFKGPYRLKGTIRVIYAGNIGKFQNLPLLTEGISLCFKKYPELQLIFLGDGSLLPELKKKWSSNTQVQFIPFLPYNHAEKIISQSDIGLVSINENIYRVAYPSKIPTYINLGLKILALVETNSEISYDLAKNNYGVVPRSHSPLAISEALEKLIKEIDKNKKIPFDNYPCKQKNWIEIIQDL